MGGENDTEVRNEVNKEFASKMDEAGLDIEAISYPDVGHFFLTYIPGLQTGSLDVYPNTEAAPKILDFLKDKLINAEISIFSSNTIEMIKKRERDELSK